MTTVVLLRWCWHRANEIQLRSGQVLDIGAAPFVGRWSQAPLHLLVPPLVVGVVGVGWGPVVARAARWRAVVAGAAGGWVAWVVALALVDGRAATTASIRSRYDYLAAVPKVGSPGRFLSHFVANIGSYPTHVRGHPPGAVLLLWSLDRLGLGGSGWALAVCLLGGAATVAGVLVATRSLAGEAWARQAAPFVALAPAAVIATNFDLLYASLAAWSVALVALATEPERSGPGRRVAAGTSGVLLGAALLGSYGLAPMALPVVVVGVVRHRARVLGLVAGAAAAVVAAPALWGFWWPAGLAATRRQYWAGLASRRPAGYFAVADLVVLAAVLGPVVVVATTAVLARVLRPAGRGSRAGSLVPRRSVPWPLAAVVAAVAAVVAVALASQMSKGEVERIWQPFMPWFVVLVPVLSARRRRIERPLLAVHVATGLVLVAVLRSPW